MNGYVWVVDYVGDLGFETLVVNDFEEFYIYGDPRQGVTAWYKNEDVETRLPKTFFIMEDAQRYVEAIVDVMYEERYVESRFDVPKSFCFHSRNSLECHREYNHEGPHHHELESGVRFSWLGKKESTSKVSK
jgi:hypothetical protein